MLALSGYAIVAEMAVDIANVIQRIIFCAEAQIAVSVEPDSQGADLRHEYPESDIEFPALQIAIVASTRQTLQACPIRKRTSSFFPCSHQLSRLWA